MELLFESRTNLDVDGQLHFFQQCPEIHPEFVVKPDTFADGLGVTIYGSVLRDGGRYRMWYHAIPADWDMHRDMSSIAYAESDDGIVWRNLERSRRRPLCRRVRRRVRRDARVPLLRLLWHGHAARGAGDGRLPLEVLACPALHAR